MTGPDRSDALYRELDGKVTRADVDREERGMSKSERHVPERELCPERPFPALSACLLPAGHDGPHVLARGRGSIVSFYEPTKRGASFTCVREATIEGEISRTRLAYLWPAIQAVDTKDFLQETLDKS